MDKNVPPYANRKTEQTVTSLSNTFYVYKAMAILFVAMAHCVYDTPMIAWISAAFGSLGVPMFLFTSGFFFNRGQNAKEFWRRKLQSILIPWVIYGTLLYIFACLLNNFTKIELPFLKWMFGNGSWLYFVPVLIQCFVLFRICHHKWYDAVVFLLFLLHNALCILDIIPHLPWYSKYQMVFNWCGFFQLGMLARKHLSAVMECMNRKSRKVAAVGLWLAALIFYIGTGNIGYWAPFGLLFELLGMIAAFVIADLFLKKVNLLIDIGKNTYVIFFLHMQFGIGAMRRLFTSLGIMDMEWLMLLLRPVTIVLSVYAGIKLLQFISKKLGLEKLFRIVRI